MSLQESNTLRHKAFASQRDGFFKQKSCCMLLAANCTAQIDESNISDVEIRFAACALLR